MFKSLIYLCKSESQKVFVFFTDAGKEFLHNISSQSADRVNKRIPDVIVGVGEAF
jgi:hypothetical protein